ncbi:hypothetical protein, partial [Streptomyces alkaliterrae]|uniref:hypothetical protein n=1 Tax=Streptomyces alkaliterrae TaxID=2213162 RepID=UPI001E2C305E
RIGGTCAVSVSVSVSVRGDKGDKVVSRAAQLQARRGGRLGEGRCAFTGPVDRGRGGDGNSCCRPGNGRRGRLSVAG